ncbi:MAG: hypothetical protein ACFCA4_01800 [Cyanophyceae cyanobacterium]
MPLEYDRPITRNYWPKVWNGWWRATDGVQPVCDGRSPHLKHNTKHFEPWSQGSVPKGR